MGLWSAGRGIHVAIVEKGEAEQHFTTILPGDRVVISRRGSTRATAEAVGKAIECIEMRRVGPSGHIALDG